MHSRREKVFQEIYDAQEAKSKVCMNTCRYYFGLVLVGITASKSISKFHIFILVVSIIHVFSFSAKLKPDLSRAWGWSTLFAVIGDFLVIDGIFILFATFLTMTVGSAPDSCGRCRNCWLGLVPVAIRDAAE